MCITMNGFSLGLCVPTVWAGSLMGGYLVEFKKRMLCYFIFKFITVIIVSVLYLSM